MDTRWVRVLNEYTRCPPRRRDDHGQQADQRYAAAEVTVGCLIYLI
jgi:hypothetical protein